MATLGPGKSFGELALLHRAAAPCTVIASSDSVVWHLDRLTFRTILAGMSAQRRSLYNDFLRQVPLFGILDENDRCKIADTLTTMHFADEEIVCCEGSCSNAFYFILTGQVAVYQRDGSEFRFIRTLNPGIFCTRQDNITFKTGHKQIIVPFSCAFQVTILAKVLCWTMCLKQARLLHEDLSNAQRSLKMHFSGLLDRSLCTEQKLPLYLAKFHACE